MSDQYLLVAKLAYIFVVKKKKIIFSPFYYKVVLKDEIPVIFKIYFLLNTLRNIFL